VPGRAAAPQSRALSLAAQARGPMVHAQEKNPTLTVASVGCRRRERCRATQARRGRNCHCRAQLDALLAAIAGQGYQVVGPTVRDGAIVYGDVSSSADLPVGWSDEQDGGTYRRRRREDEAVFGYAVGLQSWKQLLHPPNLRLCKARRGESGEGMEIIEESSAGARSSKTPPSRPPSWTAYSTTHRSSP